MWDMRASHNWAAGVYFYNVEDFSRASGHQGIRLSEQGLAWRFERSRLALEVWASKTWSEV